MSSPSPSIASAPASPPQRLRPSRQAAACWLAAALAVAAAWWGGAAGVLAAFAAALAAAAATRLQGAGTPPAGAEVAAPEGAAAARVRTPPAQAGRVGAEVMVSQVVPVWSRQMEITRQEATKGIDELLGSFGTVSTTLDDLLKGLDSAAASAAPGAIDQALAIGEPAVHALLAPSERAFRERDAMVAMLGRCAATIGELQQQAKRSREIARHARLVAFNASIEATRNGQAGSGSQTVAAELRTLAARMADTGAAIDRQVLALAQEVGQARRDGEIHDTSAEELRLELDHKAREAMRAMLGALGNSMRSSTAMRELGAGARRTIDEAFVQFQFGDRVSQMLDIVGRDMHEFARWVAAHPQATQTDAAEWLDKLQAAYTMDEQRSQHHGNVHIERESAVEFF